ncbi:MAG: AAA-like domain-containing protein [Acidobacteriota bacterium]
MEKQAILGYQFGEYYIDLKQRELQYQGKPVPLTMKAFEVLLLLVENSGQTIIKNRLLDEIWPDSFVEEINIARQISTLRQTLGDSRDKPIYIETLAKRGYRFIAQVNVVNDENPTNNSMSEAKSLPSKRKERLISLPLERIEAIGGAVPLDSNFYITRSADEQVRAAISRRDSIILIKGPRQIGKTSLLARALQQAREAGVKVVLTDFQILSSIDLQSAESLYLLLGDLLSEELDLDISLRSCWQSKSSPNINFKRYIKSQVLAKLSTPIVWGLDEVDRITCYDYSSAVFGLFRSWHNMRSLDPAGPWHYLTLAIAYATEVQLFIKDPNQSPFNVGTQVLLDDFTISQVQELNYRYGGPLHSDAQILSLFNLVGGHPYLVRLCLYEVASGKTLKDFEQEAQREEGLLGSHLRRILNNLNKDTELCYAFREILHDRPAPQPESFYRLRSAGLVIGYAPEDARARCQLYTNYFKKRL